MKEDQLEGDCCGLSERWWYQDKDSESDIVKSRPTQDAFYNRKKQQNLAIDQIWGCVCEILCNSMEGGAFHCAKEDWKRTNTWSLSATFISDNSI